MKPWRKVVKECMTAADQDRDHHDNIPWARCTELS